MRAVLFVFVDSEKNNRARHQLFEGRKIIFFFDRFIKIPFLVLTKLMNGEIRSIAPAARSKLRGCVVTRLMTGLQPDIQLTSKNYRFCQRKIIPNNAIEYQWQGERMIKIQIIFLCASRWSKQNKNYFKQFATITLNKRIP